MHAGSYSERVLSWITDCGFAPPAHILDCNSTLTNWQLISCTDMLTVLPAVFFQTPSVGAQTSGLLRLDMDLPEAVLAILRLTHDAPSADAPTMAELVRTYTRPPPAGLGGRA